MFFFLLPFRGDWRHFCYVVLSSIDCLRLTNWNGILLHSRIWAANLSSTMAFNLNFFDVFSNFVLVHETVCRFNLTREKVYIIRNGTQRTHTLRHTCMRTNRCTSCQTTSDRIHCIQPNTKNNLYLFSALTDFFSYYYDICSTPFTFSPSNFLVVVVVIFVFFFFTSLIVTVVVIWAVSCISFILVAPILSICLLHFILSIS